LIFDNAFVRKEQKRKREKEIRYERQERKRKRKETNKEINLKNHSDFGPGLRINI